MEKRDKIDDVLKSKLRDFESGADIPSWSEMQRRMALAGSTPDERPVGLRRRLFLRYASAAAALIAVITIVVYLSGVQEEELAVNHDLPAFVPSAETAESGVPESRDEKLLGDLLASARKITIRENNRIADKDGTYMAIAAGQAMENVTGAENEVTADGEADGQPSTPTDDPPAGIYRGGNYSSGGNSGKTLGDYGTQRRTGRSWSAGAYFNGSKKTSSVSNYSPAGFLSSAISSPLVEMNSVGNVIDIKKQRELKHRYPISAGISVRKELTQRWGIESGLLYTYLESVADMNGTFDYKYKQKLHYLGIPLYASYSIINSNRWNLYVNAGGMIELPLAARGTTSIYEGGRLLSKETLKLYNKGAVWSLGANVGVGYKLMEYLGVYVEPGLGYYFENENQPESYRTGHPLMFNLKTGVRVNF